MIVLYSIKTHNQKNSAAFYILHIFSCIKVNSITVNLELCDLFTKTIKVVLNYIFPRKVKIKLLQVLVIWINIHFTWGNYWLFFLVNLHINWLYTFNCNTCNTCFVFGNFFYMCNVFLLVGLFFFFFFTNVTHTRTHTQVPRSPCFDVQIILL